MKIKQIAKYLLPIVLVVGIVVAFLLSRMSQPSGRDNVLTGDVELPQDQEGNYIAQRYESNLIPSDTGYTVNEQPVDNVIRVDDGESGKESEYIYIEVADTDIKDLYKKDDLMNGHQSTNTTTSITEDMKNTEDFVEIPEDMVGTYTGPFRGIPSEMAYDTDLIKRKIDDANELYIGMLYGRWTYNLSEEQIAEYNISAELVIASHYQAITLTEKIDEETNMVTHLSLSDGQVVLGSYVN